MVECEDDGGCDSGRSVSVRAVIVSGDCLQNECVCIARVTG